MSNGELCTKCLVTGAVVDTGSASGRKHRRCPKCGATWREKNPAAVALGRLGAQASNAARTPEERTALGEKAANIRWEKIKRSY